MSEQLKVKVVGVDIERGRDIVHVEVPEHEVRVLRAVHGLEAIVVTDSAAGTRLLDASSDVELLRMQRIYKRANVADPVLIAYPSGAAQLADFGFSASVNRPLAPEVNTGVRGGKKKADAMAEEPKDRAPLGLKKS